jgi:hypothetical protein
VARRVEPDRLADPAVHAYQMAKALSPYVDTKVKYKKLEGKPLEKGADLEDIKANGYAVAKRFAKAIPGAYKQDKMERAADLILDSVKKALEDDYLKGVTDQEVSDMITSGLEQLVYQDLESAKRILSDHGVRHVVTNMESVSAIFDAVGGADIKVNGADRLAAQLVMLHHDIGYTTAAAKDAPPGDFLMKQHPSMSRILVKQNPFWKKAFGKKADYYLDGMATHASSSTDWKKNPWQSAVRLADNTAVFGKEKLPDLLVRDERTSKILGKMLLVQRSGGPRRFMGKDWASDADKIQFESLQDELVSVIDDMDYPDEVKESLKKSAKKDVIAHTPEFLLSMYGGKKTGYSMEEDEDGEPRVKVSIQATPERQVLDSLFGHVADVQTERMMGDYDIKGDVVKDGLSFRDLPDVDVSGKKPKFKTGKAGGGIAFEFDTSSTHDEDAITEIFGEDFAKASIRDSLLSHARRAAHESDPKKVEKLRKELLTSLGSQLDDEEKDALKKHLEGDHSGGLDKEESLDDPNILAREIMRFPLTRREKEFLGKKAGKKGAALIPILVHKPNLNSPIPWIEPVYPKCPVVRSFQQELGTRWPSYAKVLQNPLYEGVIYDTGAIACHGTSHTCPYFVRVNLGLGITCSFPKRNP